MLYYIYIDTTYMTYIYNARISSDIYTLLDTYIRTRFLVRIRLIYWLFDQSTIMFYDFYYYSLYVATSARTYCIAYSIFLSVYRNIQFHLLHDSAYFSPRYDSPRSSSLECWCIHGMICVVRSIRDLLSISFCLPLSPSSFLPAASFSPPPKKLFRLSNVHW